jgi:uncharacterized damage-inducible protein DinB
MGETGALEVNLSEEQEKEGGAPPPAKEPTESFNHNQCPIISEWRDEMTEKSESGQAKEAISAAQAEFLRDYLLPLLIGECRATSRVLEAVPEERADYRPDPRSRTARELAWHIIASDLDFIAAIRRGSFESSEAGSPVPSETIAEMRARYDAGCESGLEAIKTLTGEQLASPIPFFGTFNYETVVYLTFLMNHSIHHRGQLMAYLRAMGSTVPAIYGPSADQEWTSPEAVEAAAAG